MMVKNWHTVPDLNTVLFSIPASDVHTNYTEGL